MNILMTGAGGFIGKNFIEYFNRINGGDTLTLLTSKKINGFRCIDYKTHTFSQNELKSASPFDCILLLGAFVEHHGRNEIELTRKHLSSVNSIDYLLQNLPNIPKKIVFCSSISVYGIDSTLPYKSANGVLIDENTKVDPVRTYALSKVFAERLVQEWCDYHRVECQIIRIGTVYDLSGEQNNFLGYLIKSVNENSTFKLSAPPHQLWNFVFINDIVRWILNAVKLEDVAGVLNLVSSENHTTNELISIFEKNCNSFQYQIMDNVSQRGCDKGFISTKREKYLGEEFNPVSLTIPKMLKELK